MCNAPRLLYAGAMPTPDTQFYHLTVTPLERALPKLMEKACASGVQALVHGTPAQVEALDRALWTYHPGQFLPHGTAQDPQPERQPVFLTPGMDNPNRATLLVITNGATYLEEHGAFERLFDIFDGTDGAAAAAARERWQAYGARGYPLSYVKQKDDGGWEKTAL